MPVCLTEMECTGPGDISVWSLWHTSHCKWIYWQWIYISVVWVWLCILVLWGFGLDILFLREKSIFDVLTNEDLGYVRQKAWLWSIVNPSWNRLAKKKVLGGSLMAFSWWCLMWWLGACDFPSWFLRWYVVLRKYIIIQ